MCVNVGWISVLQLVGDDTPGNCSTPDFGNETDQVILE